MLAGIGLSLIGFLAGLLFVAAKTCCSPTIFRGTLQFFMAYAVGAILGDVSVHILPEAYKDPKMDSRFVALAFVGGILLFVLLHALLTHFGIAHSHGPKEEHCAGQSASNCQNEAEAGASIEQLGDVPVTHPSEAEEKEPEGCLDQLKGKKTEGYLNLLSSLVHNIVDGVILGVAFATGEKAIIVSTSIAIFAHEVPR
jgi:zinc transporter ZupT